MRRHGLCGLRSFGRWNQASQGNTNVEHVQPLRKQHELEYENLGSGTNAHMDTSEKLPSLNVTRQQTSSNEHMLLTDVEAEGGREHVRLIDPPLSLFCQSISHHNASMVNTVECHTHLEFLDV